MHSPNMAASTDLFFRSSLLWLISVSALAFASKPCDFPAIFNFGDSNSDTGGLSAAFSQAPWPNRITFFHRPAGRYSDGRLIIDFMANSLGLPFLHPYLDSIRANFSRGANFATAGSTIRPQNTTGPYSPFSLNVQWWQYNQFKFRSQLAQNQGGYLNKTSAEVSASLSDILDQFSAAVKDVYEEGGRTFWIHNTGPLGCLAYVLSSTSFTEDQLDEVGCAIPWNELAQDFNKKLNETVVQFRNNLPLAVITLVDIYSVKYSLFSQPEKFGFEQTLRVCCGSGGKYNYNMSAFCGKAILINGTESIVGSCEDPLVWIIWDGIHYTEAANQWVFKLILGGAFSDPPIPLKMACHEVVH